MPPTTPTRTTHSSTILRDEDIRFLLTDLCLSEDADILKLLETVRSGAHQPDAAFAQITLDDLIHSPVHNATIGQRAFNVKTHALRELPLSTDELPEWIQVLVGQINDMAGWFSNRTAQINKSVRNRIMLPQPNFTFKEMAEALAASIQVFLEEEPNLIRQLDDADSESLGRMSHQLEILSNRLKSRVLKEFAPIEETTNFHIDALGKSLSHLQIAALTVARIAEDMARTTRILAVQKKQADLKDWAEPQRAQFSQFLAKIEADQHLQRATDTTRDRLRKALGTILISKGHSRLGNDIRNRPLTTANKANPKVIEAMRDLQDMLLTKHQRARLRVQHILEENKHADIKFQWDFDIALEAIGLPRHGQSTDLPARHISLIDTASLAATNTHEAASGQHQQAVI